MKPKGRITSWNQNKKNIPVKLGGHRDCVSGDIIFLVFHVISQDHVTK